MDKKEIIQVIDEAKLIQDNTPVPNPDPSPIPQAVLIEVAIDIAKESLQCFTDYLKCKEHETTERQRIRANLKSITEEISTKKEMYIKTIETNFAERKELYSKADESLKKAVEVQDVEMLKCIYNYILNVYSGSEDATIRLAEQFVKASKVIDYFG